MEGIAHSRITKYLRQPHFSREFSEPCHELEIPILDGTILDIRNKQRFSSVQESTKLTSILKTRVYRHFASSLGFVVKSLH
jgi:hypothetical protein